MASKHSNVHGICIKCGVQKDLEKDFYNESGKNYKRTTCKECMSGYQKDYLTNPKNLDTHRESVRKNNPRTNANMKFYRYGLPYDDFASMIEEQDNKCKICGKELDGAKYTHVDHDHKTGIIRGILCGACNVGLGCFKDDPQLLLLASAYLISSARSQDNE